ncbi:MAG: type I methionyl aminopeptidase [Armatimonadota bacterium]
MPRRRRRRPTVKTEAQLDRMRRAGSIVAEVLAAVAERARPGVSTAELDAVGAEIIERRGAVPSFLGYETEGRRYPAATCISVNDVVVHGIPHAETKLRSGDIVSVDVGACYEGYHADAATTVAVGEVSEKARALLRVTEQALYLGIGKAVVGGTVRNIGAAIQEHVEAGGFSVVRALVGHGIGKTMHEPPSVPNFVTEGQEVRLQGNMTLAIEPMVNAGGHQVKVDEDGWTMRTADGCLSAHFEHTVVVRSGAAEVLTSRDAAAGG